jgi:hypothetical protein
MIAAFLPYIIFLLLPFNTVLSIKYFLYVATMLMVDSFYFKTLGFKMIYYFRTLSRFKENYYLRI